MRSAQAHSPVGPLRLRFYSCLLRLRPALFASLLKRLLGVRRVLARLPSGRSLWVDPVSQFGLTLLSESAYELTMTELLRLVLRPGDVFLDIGGNEGYFSVIAATLGRPVRVFCIEPQSRLQNVIVKNLEINQVSEVSVHQLALTDHEGEIELYCSPSTNTGSSSLFASALPRVMRSASWLFKEKVRCTTLDSFVRENQLDRIRLAKIDCEGAEIFIIRGACQTLREKRIDFLALEYHPHIFGNNEGKQLDEFLHSCGYALTCVKGQTIYHLADQGAELSGL
jgi:FkbM family methyltransferase